MSSENVCSLDWPSEVLYRRLMSIVDDYGRHEANLQLLRSKCYPLQTDAVRVADISRWMAACQKAGLVVLYEVQGKQYIELRKFGQQQRSASKCPPPPSKEVEEEHPNAPVDHLLSTDSKRKQVQSNDHLGVSVSVSVSESEDVSGGKPPAELPPGFASFWKTWPVSDRKQARGKCLEAWKKAHAECDAALILAHVETLKTTVFRKDGGQFIPAPLTYLNQRRWEGSEGAESPPQESFV